MKVLEVTTPQEMYRLYDVLAPLYPDLSHAQFNAITDARLPQGYRMIGVFDDQKSCHAAAGFWINIRFYCGKFIQIDNMVKAEHSTLKGAGTLLLDWIKEEGALTPA